MRSQTHGPNSECPKINLKMTKSLQVPPTMFEPLK